MGDAPVGVYDGFSFAGGNFADGEMRAFFAAHKRVLAEKNRGC